VTFRRVLLTLAAAAFAAASAFAAAGAGRDDGVTLHGDRQQGGLMIGRTDPQAVVTFGDRRLRVSPEGWFVFGFDRDAKPAATLRIKRPGHAESTERIQVDKRDWEIQRINGLPPSKVNPPPEVAARIDREYREIQAAHSQDLDRADFMEPLQWPVKGTVSGVFGSQRILNGTPKQPHYGVDVAVPVGTQVHAPAGGIVTLAERDLYFTGGTLIIDHGHGLSSILVHLSKIEVKVGDEVKQGQVVAESGMTGRATGPHLHWGVYWFDTHIDPQSAMAVTAER